jgi:hypothetical protein
MPFDLFDDLFERNDRKRHGRRSGLGGLLDRVLGGERDDDRDDRYRRGADRDGYERARYRRDDDDDDDDDRRAWHDRDDDRGYGRRRRDRDFDLFD